MADFDLAMAITADGSQAAAAVNKVASSLDKTAAAERNAASAATALEGSTDRAAAAAGRNATAQSQAGQATAAATANASRLVVAQSNLSVANARVTAANAALAVAHDKVAAAAGKSEEAQNRAAASLTSAQARVEAATAGATRAQQRLAEANKNTTTTSAAAAFGARNLGQQVGDFATQVSLGGGVVRAFSSQIGQVGLAMADMGGKVGAVGRFLVGPWGIALTVATLVLAPFVEKLFEGNKAAADFYDKAVAAASAADSFGSAQASIGRIIDTTTGKLKTQNLVLIESIRLQAQAGIAKAAEERRQARRDLLEAGNPGVVRRVGNAVAAAPIGAIGATLGVVSGIAGGRGSGVDPRITAITSRFANGTTDIRAARIEIEKLGLSAERTNAEVAKLVRFGTANEDIAANQAVVASIDTGRLDPRLKPYERGKKPPKPKKPPSNAARDEFGRDTADRLQSLRDGLSDVPAAVRQANQQLRQLDDLIDDLARKKPPGFEKLIADARALRPLIADNLNKPFNDYVKSQSDSLAILRLTGQGRTAEAEALRVVLGLEREIGPLTPARKDAVLATVQALEAEQRQIEINRASVSLYLDALGGIKSIVEDATQAFVRGDLGQFIKSPKRLLDAFQSLSGRVLFERIFGQVFRDLQDQVNGVRPVEDASQRMAEAVDQVTRQTDNTNTALAELERAARSTAGALPGVSAAGPGGAAATPGESLASLLSRYVGPSGPDAAGGSTTDPNTGDVVVTGRRIPAIRRSPTELFSTAIGQVATRIGSIFTNPENAAKIGANIGKFAGKGLEGAAVGAAVNSAVKPLANALGLRTSATGAQIGGAIGSFIPIPGGQVIGSIAGSLLGGLFKTNKTGSATIGNVGGQAGVTGTAGNSASTIKTATGAGNSVSDALNSIVDQLGGSLGDFAVSIGFNKGKFRVDTSGRGRTTAGKSNDGVVGYKDEAEAVAAALLDAISDGAVAGISEAMQRALRSTSDVDRAVREALKVKQVEEFIASASDARKAEFNAYDRAAAERVAIAKRYGLDVVAVEKENAEQRKKLAEAALQQQVGALQDVLTDLTSGDLFEGTGAERRSAILAKISDTRAKVDAGEAGATDTLAALYRNLLSTSRDTFGTAGGEYAADRQTVASGAAAVIQAEKDRLAQAAGLQQATTAAVEKVATLTDETNNLLAVNNATLGALPSAIAAAFASSGLGASAPVSLGVTARQVQLQ